MNNQQTPSPAKEPQLCIANCGFFGNEQFGQMCSKCYKMMQSNASSNNPSASASSQQISGSAAPVSTPAISAPSSTIASPSSTATFIPVDDARISSDSSAVVDHVTADIQSGGTAADVKETATSTTESGDKEVAVAEINPAKLKRCNICKLKMNMAKQISNKCKCGYVFCDAHKISANHNCTFDYAESHKKVLTNKNPRIVSDSFERI
ncbi:hypothetical protein MIR68_002833 [Amoeboaphelidium protococcarum]|nr:hypothetical protein MIR68_002833 [Amoeboaphelidium protococcarum]